MQFRLPAAAEVRADVYDVAGRRVAGLLRAVLPAGEHPATWDGRDAAGQRVAAGIYQLRVSAGGALAVRKVVMIE